MSSASLRTLSGLPSMEFLLQMERNENSTWWFAPQVSMLLLLHTCMRTLSESNQCTDVHTSRVTGRNGVSMKKDWADVGPILSDVPCLSRGRYQPLLMLRSLQFPNVYLSVAAPKFPNFYFIGGPTGNWAQGSVLATVSSVLGLPLSHNF